MRILIASLLLIIMSCEEKKDSITVTDTDTTHFTPPVLVPDDVNATPVDSIVSPDQPFTGQCYIQTSGRDTTLLQLSREGNMLFGRMLFDNYQIDGSHGTVKGSIKGNIIELWYDAEAEGTRFHRQLFFKEDGDQLLWGKGIQEVRNDSTFFKDPAAATFSPHLFMRKSACTAIWQ